MENRFLEATRPQRRRAGSHPAIVRQHTWAAPMAASDRVLIVFMENGGVDLGIPELVGELLSAIPGSGILPESAKAGLVSAIRDRLRSVTDDLLEGAELLANRYTAAKPDPFGDVVILRNGTGAYADLKGQLIAQTRARRIVDLFVLTHGGDRQIAATGGTTIDDNDIRAIRTELGQPVSLRSVYMMNCVGSTLNQAWLDVGAKASSGSIRNNYLPEPTMYLFWQKWKAGEAFETAVTGAYRETINLMNATVRGFVDALPIPGTSALAQAIDFSAYDFVRDSAPVVQGQRGLTVSSDELTFATGQSSSLATTVLPAELLRALGEPDYGAAPGRPSRSVSAAGLELIKSFEGFRPQLYNDPAGHCTIGYGTLMHTGNCDGRPAEQPYAQGIDEAKASELLGRRVAEFQQVINDRVSVPLNQNQNDALVSFVYNTGGAAFASSTLLRVLNEAHYDAVPAELRKWTKARKDGRLVDLPGLVKRRDAEAELFVRPVAPAAAAQSLFAGSLGGVDYSIPGTLEPLRQNAPMTCWATVIAMMWCWRRQVSMSVTDVLAEAGPEWVDRYTRGEGLDVNLAKSLYDALGLVTLESFNPTIDGWEALLRQYGPLYVDVGAGTSATTHALIVTGIGGDGTAAGTAIRYVDPAGGQSVSRNFGDFLHSYEAPGAVNGWPWVIVHWPPPLPSAAAAPQSLPVRHSSSFVGGAGNGLVTMQSPLLVLGVEVADAAQIGLGAIAVAQTAVSASQGSFTMTYDRAQRLLTTEARAQMPGAQSAKRSYSASLLNLGIGRINAAEADVIIEWEGNAYGEIGTPVIRRRLETSTDWSRSSANIAITKLDRIPPPHSDPRTWPITYTYEGTYDPWGNGYFEFTGEFEINAFGGLHFNRHQVVSRSAIDFAIGGTPEDKVARGRDVTVAVPEIPQEQVDYLKTRLP
jgi:GH24 family phage-related lysozyme (muramidase)